MRLTPHTIFIGIFFLLVQAAVPTFGQLGFSINVKKPKPYEDRVLRSEKTDNLKFNKPRHFIQNTFTHYNYFFNANNKLNEVLEQAKLFHKDDYTKLLTFYNYTLDETSQFKIELDSLVYKAQTAIVLHDLRNDWIDNMYLIWGAAYYLRKDFDSAFLTFQFINHAFAPKEKDGYYKFIGSKADGNLATNIANKEKSTLPKRIFSEPPSRNDAFIWQVRTFLAMEQYGEAASLLAALRNDPVFPKRLQNDLKEVQSLYFYKQEMWDSSATYLVEALSNAENKLEKARWEYLIGQLYEKSNHFADAQTYYAKVVSHTTDPVMEMHARLSSIRVNKDGGENYIEKNVAELLKMARRDKYADYRDIIYFTAAQMEQDRNHIDPAEKYFLKSVSYQPGNPAQRNKAFLQLANIAFAKKKYRQAYNFYDSLQMGDPELTEPEKITERKEILGKIAFNTETITAQDSLQHLAAISEDERKALVKKLVRKIRKSQGLKEENYKPQQGLTSSPQSTTASSDIFGSTQQKGEWYFYNATSRTKGAGDFKTKWGNRPNVDNWRRASAITNAPRNGGQPGNVSNFGAKPGSTGDQPTEITYDALYDNIPLTPEKIKASNDSIQWALFALVKIYAEELEDCSSCLETSDTLRQRFPEFEKMDEVLFHMYHCYTKNGETAKAELLKKEMVAKHDSSSYTSIVKTGKNPAIKKEDPEATKTYQGIYDLFIEGNFEEALEQKKIADSMYSSNFWNPQLLYIEAVYHAKQREDTTAQHVLTQIMTLYPNTPLATKAETLYNVISRRTIIENELANLVLERPVEEPPVQTEEPVIEEKGPTVKKDTAAATQKQVAAKPTIENKTIVKKSGIDSIKTPPPSVSKFDYNPDDKYYAVIILNKVDKVFSNEAKNAFSIFNREKFYNKTFDYSTVDIDPENKLLLIGTFENAQAAVDYVQQAKPVSSTRIMPWLKPEKYSFSIISSRNMDILKTNLKLDEYRKFAEQNWQGKF